MTSQHLLEQARDGDAAAIAQLLNEQLNPKGIQARAQTTRDGTLNLNLTGGAQVAQASIENYLQSAFQKLAAPGIRQINLSFWANNGLAQPLWHSSIPLPSAIAPGDSRPVTQPVEQPVTVDQPVSRAIAKSSPEPIDNSVAQPATQPVTQPVATPVSEPEIQPERTVPAVKPRYANPFSIWFQWQAAGLGALILTWLLGSGILALVMFFVIAPREDFFSRIPLNLWTMGLGLGGLGLILLLPMGLILGDGQTKLLRKWLPGIGGWRWVTPLGFLLGFGLAVGAHFLSFTLLGGIVLAAIEGASSLSIALPVLLGVIACSAVGIGLGFLVLGFLQWLLLLGEVPRAGQWIWSNALGSAVSWLLGLGAGLLLTQKLFAETLSADSDGFLLVVVVFLGATVSWFLFHGLTGITMARLLAKLPLQDK